MGHWCALARPNRIIFLADWCGLHGFYAAFVSNKNLLRHRFDNDMWDGRKNKLRSDSIKERREVAMLIALERIERSLRPMNCCISPKPYIYIFRLISVWCVRERESGMDGSQCTGDKCVKQWILNTVGVNAATLKITIALVRGERKRDEKSRKKNTQKRHVPQHPIGAFIVLQLRLHSGACGCVSVFFMFFGFGFWWFTLWIKCNERQSSTWIRHTVLKHKLDKWCNFRMKFQRRQFCSCQSDRRHTHAHGERVHSIQ